MERSPAALQTAPSPPNGKRSSGMEDASPTWLKLHGSEDWDGLLHPLHQSLRDEILTYGRFALATYEAYNFEAFSRHRGSCRYELCRLLNDVGLGDSGYVVTRHLYATMTELPKLLRCLLKLVPTDCLQGLLRMDSWSEDSNWMGYVAVSGDEESRRLGRRNILVAWRGSVEPSEWIKNAQWGLEPLRATIATGRSRDAMVERGFHSVYTSKSRCKKFTKLSASEQVMAEIRRQVDTGHGRREEVSLTVTGHSLGAALALLSALDAAAASIPGLSHVSVISFASPQVGNAAFVAELAERGVKVLRVFVDEDEVPKLPGLLDSHYQHAGVEVELHMDGGAQTSGCGCLQVLSAHSLETYLHLVSRQQQRRRPLPSPSEPGRESGGGAVGAQAPLLERVPDDGPRPRECP